MTPRDTTEVIERLRRAELLSFFEGKRVLITGSRGFLGRAFVAVFAGIKGVEVVAVDQYALAHQMGAAPAKTYPNVEQVDHDVTKPFPIHGPVDLILSLAGIASPAIYKKYPLETLDVCVDGTRNMLELAQAKGARMLYSSSSEVYADPTVVPTPEHFRGAINPHHPRAPYDVSKLLGETLCWVFSHHFKVDARVVRYFNVFGPGLSVKDYRVMGRFASAIVNGEQTEVIGYGGQTRAFTYLTDALVGSFFVLAKGDFGPYNVGNEKTEVSMRELAMAFEARRPGGPKPFVTKEPPPEYEREPQRRCPDTAKLRALGFTAEVALADGVDRFVEWALEAYRGG